MSEALQKYEKPGVLERIGNAFKSLAGNIPFENEGSNFVQVYSNWPEWDRALGSRYAGTNANYANLVGNLWESSLVMPGIRWLGNTLPEPPVQVKESSGNKGESEVVPDHPLVNLWHRPNAFYSGSTLTKGIGFSWLLKGDVYIRKVWDDARIGVAELWWEPHWRIRPRYMNDNKGNYIPKSQSSGNPDNKSDNPKAWISYYEVDRGNMKYRLEVTDVIHLRDGFDPVNTRCGLSGLGALLREIYGDNEAANLYGQLMGGSAVPKFILSIDEKANMTPQLRMDLQDELERRTKGDNRTKPLVVQGGKVERLQFSPQELDLRETRYMSEQRFSAVTGIPAEVLELGTGKEHSIYNNVRQASERAVDSYLSPLWSHIQEELTVQLLSNFEHSEEKSLVSIKASDTRGLRYPVGGYDGYAVKATSGRMRYVSHDLSKVRALQEDEDAKHRRVGMDYRNGIVDRSEARSGLGYEVRDEDKDLFFPNTSSKGGEALPMATTPSTQQPIKKAPEQDEIASMRESWIRDAPDVAKAAFDATVKGKANGESKVLA